MRSSILDIAEPDAIARFKARRGWPSFDLA
jgi:hypothetical protein